MEGVVSVPEARGEAVRAEIEELQMESPAQTTKSGGVTGDARKPGGRLAINFPAFQLKTKLEATRRNIDDEEDFRRRRLDDLRAQLAQRLAMYGESYPSVVSLQQEIEASKREPPELAALRTEEQRLDAAYAKRKRERDVTEGDSANPLERTGTDARTDRGEADTRLTRAT